MKHLLGVSLLFLILISCTQTPEQPPTRQAAQLTTVTVLPPVVTTAVSPTAVSPPTASSTPSPTATSTPSATPTPSFPLYTGPPLDPALMGIQIHMRDEDFDGLFAHLTSLGIGWVKVQISWKLYQPSADAYHQERFAELDEFVARANDAHLQILLGISKAPEWSRPTTEMDGPPSDFALFQQFTSYVAGRYQGQVAAYELWNEPNLQREWNGQSLNAAELVRLIEFGAAGIRQADPNAIIISAAPATTGINDGLTAIDDRIYLQQMLENGVADFVDAIGAHPYGAANPPESRVTSSHPAITSHNDHPSFFFLDTLSDYQNLLTQYGVNKPIWVTEFGWGSFENISPTVPAGVEFMTQTSAWQQAEYIAQAFALAQKQPAVGPMMLWNLNFAPLLGQAFSESGYSILDTQGIPRPAYWTLQTAIE